MMQGSALRVFVIIRVGSIPLVFIPAQCERPKPKRQHDGTPKHGGARRDSEQKMNEDFHRETVCSLEELITIRGRGYSFVVRSSAKEKGLKLRRLPSGCIRRVPTCRCHSA